ncbi:hypothetical protein D3P07_26070 [Paenibacillus sp. 1011MAR3C5]|uniref:hypothetical protein n=1 Tax=Paenibacillus sp. 1011MAR3C5 TaxID=1675787 RepID=UPI000E6CDA3F|nr:hypothetical protein [Paenibacillus sp. 1011MAR3C5]RJE82782.1 hypothetical protein D3P07_26070 [Paenibacillus sp. 1011MAR3C5]
MFKYNIQVPLEYFRFSLLGNHNMSGELKILLEDSVLDTLDLIIKKGDFESQEKFLVTISQEEHVLSISSFYADNETYALDMANNMVNKYVQILSYVIQSQNSNSLQFQIKFTYNQQNIKVTESKYSKYEQFVFNDSKREEDHNVYMEVYDSLRIKDSVHMIAASTFRVNDVSQILGKIGMDVDLWFLMDCYYHSLGLIDSKSKYFNLFVIIEYIEKNIFHESVDSKIYKDNQIIDLMDSISEAVSRNTTTKDHRDRIQSRIKQIFESATDKGRIDKLYSILTESLAITDINYGLDKIELSKELVAKFIKTRNGLFHAKILTEEEKQGLGTLSYKLLLLSESVLKELIKRKEENVI